MGFSRRVNVKRFTGPPHSNRDRQFRYIRRQRRRFQKQGCPTIRIDTKKKELIGDFKNAGRKWSRALTDDNHGRPQHGMVPLNPFGSISIPRRIAALGFLHTVAQDFLHESEDEAGLFRFIAISAVLAT